MLISIFFIIYSSGNTQFSKINKGNEKPRFHHNNKMKKGNRTDIQLYASDIQNTNVTIGEWKAYRESLSFRQGTWRLCTYADLVCNYIKKNREILFALGITGLPHEESVKSQIDAIVIRRGRECVPYSSATTPVSLTVYLKKPDDENYINFTFSGQYRQFSSLMCFESIGSYYYDYNDIVAYESVSVV